MRCQCPEAGSEGRPSLRSTWVVLFTRNHVVVGLDEVGRFVSSTGSDSTCISMREAVQTLGPSGKREDDPTRDGSSSENPSPTPPHIGRQVHRPSSLCGFPGSRNPARGWPAQTALGRPPIPICKRPVTNLRRHEARHPRLDLAGHRFLSSAAPAPRSRQQSRHLIRGSRGPGMYGSFGSTSTTTIRARSRIAP